MANWWMQTDFNGMRALEMDKITKSIMDQDIKQSFLLIWFINWIKPIHTEGD